MILPFGFYKKKAAFKNGHRNSWFSPIKKCWCSLVFRLKPSLVFHRKAPAMASGLAGKVRRSMESDEFDLSGYDQAGSSGLGQLWNSLGEEDCMGLPSMGAPSGWFINVYFRKKCIKCMTTRGRLPILGSTSEQWLLNPCWLMISSGILLPFI